MHSQQDAAATVSIIILVQLTLFYISLFCLTDSVIIQQQFEQFQNDTRIFIADQIINHGDTIKTFIEQLFLTFKTENNIEINNLIVIIQQQNAALERLLNKIYGKVCELHETWPWHTMMESATQPTDFNSSDPRPLK